MGDMVAGGLCRRILDYMPSSVLLIDAECQMVYANDLARAIVATGDGLKIVDNRLQATDPSVATRFRRMVKACIEAGGAGQNIVDVLALPRENQELPLLVRVDPIGKGSCANGLLKGDRIALLFIGDPAMRREPDPALTQRLHGVTEREARLAGLLALGYRLQEVAQEMEITYNTARDHLRSVMHKTNTSSQSQLLRLMWSSPTWFD